jgi:hypothetical protein
MPLHPRDRLIRLVVIGHFYKTKTFGATRILIFHNASTGHLTTLAKQLRQFIFSHFVTQITHVEFFSHGFSLFLKCPNTEP